jgi:hypothetical protein
MMEQMICLDSDLQVFVYCCEEQPSKTNCIVIAYLHKEQVLPKVFRERLVMKLIKSLVVHTCTEVHNGLYLQSPLTTLTMNALLN